MADESLANLTRFYHEFIRPDTERVLEGLDTVTQRMEAFENRTLLHFDEIYKRLDDLKKEYDALSAGVKRLEQYVYNGDGTLNKTEARHELDQIKTRIADLEHRVADLETELSHGEND